MAKVKDWLYDFYSMLDEPRGVPGRYGISMKSIIGDDIWFAEVESVEEANSLVNARIDSHIAWASGFKRK